jgi:hypothetical protein
VSLSSQGWPATAAAASLQVARRGRTAAVLSSGSSVPEQQLRMVVGRAPPAKAPSVPSAPREAEMREKTPPPPPPPALAARDMPFCAET